MGAGTCSRFFMDPALTERGALRWRQEVRVVLQGRQQVGPCHVLGRRRHHHVQDHQRVCPAQEHAHASMHPTPFALRVHLHCTCVDILPPTAQAALWLLLR